MGAVVRWKHQRVGKAFNRWQEAVALVNHMHALLSHAVLRWQHQNLARAVSRWLGILREYRGVSVMTARRAWLRMHFILVNWRTYTVRVLRTVKEGDAAQVCPYDLPVL